MWDGDWTKIPMGLPGLETLLPLAYTRGVLGGRLSIEEMCMKLSTNPARIMGLAPRKGSIAIGADADLAIIHPARTHKVEPKTMETNADWSPYNGWDLAGFSRTTISRGEVIVDDYRVVGKEGRGVWLRREPGTGNREQREQGTGNGEQKPRGASVPGSQFPVPAGAGAQ
jgi:dihydropyrimidinase